MPTWLKTLGRLMTYDADREFYAKVFPDSVKPVDLMRLRKMRKSDVPAILAIETVNYEFPWIEEVFLDCFRVNGYHCWVCVDENDIVGYVILSIIAGEAHILNISVASAYQRFGVGQKMMQHVIIIAAKQAEKLFLEVRPSNTKARALYAKLGFHSIGIRKEYYPSSLGREDALVLALDLTQIPFY
jgi:ribosomal-protein-alanine N-acetyltransferase